MIISVEFNSLVTFDCTYGECVVNGGEVRIFVEKGLVLKKSKLIKDALGAKVVECGGDDCSKVEHVFPVHYIYDPVRDVEYIEWELEGELLSARAKDGEWLKYKSKSESSYAMHEYVGGCWFVFSGVSFSRQVVYEYALDKKTSTGNEFVQEFRCKAMADKPMGEYLLEGVIVALPGPGWMSLEVHANEFHIEIPDS
ncbi:hypothetical protein [Pseudomonas mosselii]|uniref:hypothetical protein n=1 Tax=Pseudomonas mosselii TaxID=78327 RepID=UPI000A117889|nr:hypothetical protein [Pseudomonas mosselii]ORT69753.1 hypothetical protein BTA49_13380 [Pseudomonas mosselii]